MDSWGLVSSLAIDPDGLGLLPEAGDQHQGLIPHWLELVTNTIDGDPFNLPSGDLPRQSCESHQGVAAIGLGQMW